MAEKLDLSWFDLNNYKSLKDFNLVQWINVLGFRSRLDYLLKEKKGDYSDQEKSHIDIIISTIRNSPLLSPFKEISAWESIDPSFSFNTCSVRSTSLYLLAKISEDCRLEDWAKDPVNTDPFIPVDLIFHKNPSIGDMAFTNVLVDLSGSDKQIKKDFLYWLENYRRATGYYAPKKNFTEKNSNEWISMQLLPYIDLTLIALYEGISITQYKLGSLLFPDDIEIDGTERIRRTVKPKAEWLLEQSTSLAMQSQVNSSYTT